VIRKNKKSENGIYTGKIIINIGVAVAKYKNFTMIFCGKRKSFKIKLQ